MSPSLETLLVEPPGFRSREVARFLWQRDELRAHLLADVSGLSAAARRPR